jgi:hypothetical protein
MSTGFSGSTTKGMGKLEREVESRMAADVDESKIKDRDDKFPEKVRMASIPKTWGEYEKEVEKLESKGMSTSDAQGAVDAVLMKAGYDPNTLKPKEKKMSEKKIDGPESFDKAVEKKMAPDKKRLRSVYSENYHGESFEVIVSSGDKFDIKVSVSSKIHGPFKDINSAKKAARDMIDDLEGL